MQKFNVKPYKEIGGVDLSEFIGIRGSVDNPDSGRFIDEIAGTNMITASDIADGFEMRGDELLKACITSAINEVKIDFTGLMAETRYRLNAIRDDHSLKLTGDELFTDEAEKWVSVLVETYQRKNFDTIRAFDLGLQASCAVKCKKFYVETMYGRKEYEVNLRKGYNLIPFDIESDSNYIRIIWDIKNVSLGRRRDWHLRGDGCMKLCDDYCEGQSSVYVSLEESLDGEDWERADMFGFDIRAQARCSMDKLFLYFRQELVQPILYKAAIHYLLRIKTSSRFNAQSRELKTELNDLLTRYNGGFDYSSNTRITSAYWSSVKTAIKIVTAGIDGLCDDCLQNIGDRVSNNLPA
jgi:hypothetical protein